MEEVFCASLIQLYRINEMINIDSHIEAEEEKVTIFMTTFPNTFSWMKMLEYFTEFCSIWFNFPDGPIDPALT